MLTLKGNSMTRTVLFADHTLSAATFAGKRTQAAPFLPRKAPKAGQALSPAPTVSTGFKRDKLIEAYPWLTATIRRNVGARAQRLMRSDY